jgi:nucleotide-binding universal stress UspA family protein
MIQFKNILCPVDFFPASERALEYSVALAGNYGARLHVLHVVSPVIPTSYEFPLNTAELAESLQEAAREKIEPLKARADSAGIEVDTLVRTGDIDESLLEAIEETTAEIVIMGTHGRRGFERWFLGSVTERLLRHSPVPVLTMSDVPSRIRIPPDVNKILVTTDFSEGTTEAMGYALALAQEAPAEVILYHVIEQPPERAPSVEEVSSVLEDHLSGLVPEEARAWCEVRSKVEVGTPYQRILAMAESEEVDLIVMNIHGKGLFERTLLGTTAERVLRATECPLLAVPATAPGA